jgi:hypothetical protein
MAGVRNWRLFDSHCHYICNARHLKAIYSRLWVEQKLLKWWGNIKQQHIRQSGPTQSFSCCFPVSHVFMITMGKGSFIHYTTQETSSRAVPCPRKLLPSSYRSRTRNKTQKQHESRRDYYFKVNTTCINCIQCTVQSSRHVDQESIHHRAIDIRYIIIIDAYNLPRKRRLLDICQNNG